MKLSINKEKRVVVAIMFDARKQAFQDLKRIFLNTHYKSSYSNIFNENTLMQFIEKYMPKEVRGKAKCSPEDKWIITIGIDLAEMRARKRYSEYCETVLIKYMDYLGKMIFVPIMNTLISIIDRTEKSERVVESVLKTAELSQFHDTGADK